MRTTVTAVAQQQAGLVLRLVAHRAELGAMATRVEQCDHHESTHTKLTTTVLYSWWAKGAPHMDGHGMYSNCVQTERLGMLTG